MKIKHKENPIPLRQQAYPPIADQIDAIYKFIKSLEGSGIPIPPETQEWLSQVTAVKSTYPKKEQ